MFDREQPKTPASTGPITLALAGDVMLGRLVDKVLASHRPAHPWGNTLPILRQADLLLVNLECVIARDGRPWTRTPKVFHFRARPHAIEALTVASVDVVSLANNHVLDFEEPALFEMLDRLDRAGIAHTGAGRHLAEAARPALLEARGIRVGVVGFTDNEPDWAATATTPGINYIPIQRRAPSWHRVEEGIAAARSLGADLVILSLHWGPNMRERPSSAFNDFARGAVDAGADVVHGHSAHIFQGIELYRGHPIFYDTGDFVDDYAVDPILRNDRSLLYLLTGTTNGIERIELVPVRIDRCQVNLATGEDFDWVADRLTRLSAEMGTTVRRIGDRLVVDLTSQGVDSGLRSGDGRHRRQSTVPGQ